MSTATGKQPQAELPAAKSGEFLIGGDLGVHRLGFGSMRLTGKGFGVNRRTAQKPSAFYAAQSH